MKDKKRSIFGAAVLMTVCAVISTVLASSGTSVRAVESLTSLFIDTYTLKAESPRQAEIVSSSNLSSFHFLPPLGTGGGDPSQFDDTLLDDLLVEVNEFDGVTWTVIKTFTAFGSNKETLRLAGNHYHVNWDTQGADPNRARRVRASVAGLELGSIEISPGAGPGRTWPIKFSVDRDPQIRIRQLRGHGKNEWQIAAALKNEFGLCGPVPVALMAGDLEPYPAAQIEQAVNGVCQDVIIPVTTKIADAETITVHTSYDPATGRLVFSRSTAFLQDVQAGDVLVSEPTPAAPYGLLRKITSIRTFDSQVVLESVQAKLTEAISQGTLDVTGDLLPPNPVLPARTALSKGPAGTKGLSEANVVIDEGEAFTFGPHNIDVTIDFDGDSEGTEGSGSLRVTGSVFFDARYNVGMGIRPCLGVPPACVDRFEAWAGAKQRSKLRVEGNFDGSIEEEETIYSLPLDPIIVFIGPIPVVLVPEMNIVLGVNGDAHVDFVFDGQADSTLKVGAKWLNPSYGGNGWNDISEYDLFSGRVNEANLNANMRLEAFAKLDAKIKLYGVAGPGMEGAVGLEADVATGRQPLWFLRGHVTSAAKFEIGLAEIIDVGEYKKPILNEYFHISQSVNSPPVFSNVVTDIIPVSIQTPITLGPRAGFSGYFDVSDPENDLISFEANSSLDGPINMTHTFTMSGLRNITVTARDALGASSTITLRIDVRNSLPIVNVFAGSTAEATVQFFMTAEAFDPDTNAFLPCSRIEWAAPPDTVTELNEGCNAVVSFSQPGTRTVTVTATDFNGGVGSRSITVNVLPAPANLPPVIDAASLTITASSARGGGPCVSSNGFCLVPDGTAQYLWPGFGTQLSDEFAVPLFMWVEATDPEGDQINFEWRCGTESNYVIATHTGNDVYRCTPPYLPGTPISVYAIVSDGTFRPNNKTTARIFFYRVSPN